MITVDRIEEGIAVVFDDDKRMELKLSELPEGVREGSVLVKGEGGYVIDEEAERQRKGELSKRAGGLFKKG